MLELELETAICRCPERLLSTLYAEGYRLEAQQVVLLLRRIDLLLRHESGSACIVELKAGRPPMPDTLYQVLDYGECYNAAFPNEPAPKLVVASTQMPESTAKTCANFGVETLEISESQVREALEAEGTQIPKGVKLSPAATDSDHVRMLLSDRSQIEVPENLKIQAPWTHQKVFLALVSRGQKHKDLWKKDIYVQLHSQDVNCAVLYGPGVRKYARAPLHLNPRARSWKAGLLDEIGEHIEFVQSDNKGPGREKSNFDHYRVMDWDGLANTLGL